MRVLLIKFWSWLCEEYAAPELSYVLTSDEMPSEGVMVVFRCDNYTMGVYESKQWYVVDAGMWGFDRDECNAPSAWSYIN